MVSMLVHFCLNMPVRCGSVKYNVSSTTKKKLNNPNADDKNTCACLSLADQRAHTVSFDSVRAMFCSYSRYFIYLFSLRCDVPLLLIFFCWLHHFFTVLVFFFIYSLDSIPFTLFTNMRMCVCVMMLLCFSSFFSTIFPTGNIFFIIRGASTDHVFFFNGCMCCLSELYSTLEPRYNCIQIHKYCIRMCDRWNWYDTYEKYLPFSGSFVLSVVDLLLLPLLCRRARTSHTFHIRSCNKFSFCQFSLFSRLFCLASFYFAFVFLWTLRLKHCLFSSFFVLFSWFFFSSFICFSYCGRIRYGNLYAHKINQKYHFHCHLCFFFTCLRVFVHRVPSISTKSKASLLFPSLMCICVYFFLLCGFL